jgi:cytochrome P450
MLYEVALHPEVQSRLYEETKEIFSDDMGRDVTKADLLRMTYLEMVINETMRLYAPPGIARQIHQDIITG